MNAFFGHYSAKNHRIPFGRRIDIRQIGLLYKTIVCRVKRAAVALPWLPTEQPCQLPEKTSVAQFGLEKHDRLWFRRKMRPCWGILIGSRPNSLPAVHFPAQKVPPNGDPLTILFYARSCYKTLGRYTSLAREFSTDGR
jgi:hypothetical protein